MRLKNYMNEKRKSPREIMYHGTSSKFLKKILSKGLQYKGNDVEKVGATDKTDKLNPSRVSLKGIYLTKNVMVATSAGTNAVNKFGGNTLYVIVLFQPLSGLPDEDSIKFDIRQAIEKTVRNFWGLSGNEGNQMSYIDMVADSNKRKEYTDTFITELKDKLERSHNITIDERALNRDLLEKLIITELERTTSYDLERAKKDPLVTIARGSYETYDGETVKNILNKVDEPQKLETQFLQYLDKATEMFKKIRVDRKQFAYNLRSAEPITFKGRNRIISIVEEIEGRKIGQDKNILRVHYGKPPKKFLQDYSQRVMGFINGKDGIELK